MNTLVLQFINEVRDYTDEAVRGFLSLEQTHDDQAVINGIFRNFHTIKGTSGIFPEFAPITSLAHVAEDLMDQIRNGERAIDTEMIDLFLAVLDLLTSWLDQLEQRGVLAESAQASADELCQRILALMGTPEAETAATSETVTAADTEQEDGRLQLITNWIGGIDAEELAQLQFQANAADPCFVICYTPDPSCFFFGEDPVYLFRQFSGLVKISLCWPDQLPPLSEFDPFSCQVSFVAIVSESHEQIASVFGYVLEMVTTLPLGEALQLTQETVVDAVTVSDPGADTLLDPVLDNLPPAAAVPAATERPAADADAGRKISGGSIRVDQSLINRLMDLVGEIIIAKNSLPYLGHRARDEFAMPVLAEEIEQRYASISNVVEGLQDIAMDIRMLPVARVFERFPRLVRDISNKLGKKISLELLGEETRADKDVIEALSEPLVHLVRNSLDHGIELPEQRLAAGKTAEGRITLRATQENSAIVIEINDDGKGIDPEVIRRKALEKKLMSPEVLQAMADEDVIQLVMAPNFSTADSVTDLSGRGVGMDAVHTMVTGLDGSLQLSSRLGQGTTVRLSLPLSMAITKVLTIRQAGGTFGVPADSVVEALIDVPRSKVCRVLKGPGLNVRGELYPLYSLAQQFATQPVGTAFPDRFAAVVLRVRGEIFALAVEDFSDIVDVMVKPMQGMLADNPYYTGNTILGDGSIMFILNLQEISRYAH